MSTRLIHERLTSRRDFVTGLGGGLGAMALAPSLNANSFSEGGPQPHASPRAQRVIQLFMNGGPFQADFFDPKPELLKWQGQRPKAADLRTERETGGLLASPFQFSPQGQSGVPVSELLPHLSQCIDDICVIRSVHTDNPNHGPALCMMNNGTITPKRPSMGSWFLYGLGSENDNLPGYVVLCPGKPVRSSELWTSAFLPAEYQGTYINHSKILPREMIPYLQNTTWDTSAQRRILDLMRTINQDHLTERGPDTALESQIRSMETAFRMQTEASDAFDISQESEATRNAYGDGHFANGCLLARRLAERGVRFTQLYFGNEQPWDTHSDHDKKVRKLAQEIDRPIAMLLSDLKQRGLLDDTLVIWGGEFGRTPTSQGGYGRDHNHFGFSMWMAGGGVRGGMTYGETDDFGFRAVQDKVHIHDLHATILHLMGLDHERLTFRYASRDFRLTDVHGRVVREILA
ncbi:MAG: DUF1501 domain-containing protein [Planctomycetota bacterium]|nr:DUF1501 domain-containing protein [Planctomycetota bacterium]MDA1178637.1 DUF1501 domain-containing protein [Planctomycetota bacterium]